MLLYIIIEQESCVQLTLQWDMWYRVKKLW